MANSKLEKSLGLIRKKIDLIDDKILSFLKDRSKVALEIGSLKNKNSNHIGTNGRRN